MIHLPRSGQVAPAQSVRMTDIMRIVVAAAGLIAASAGACVWHEDGSVVSVALVHRASPATSPAAAGEARTFVTAEGDVVVITRALVSVDRVELVPCSGAAAWRDVREALGPSVAMAQHSHAGDGPEGQAVDDLSRADLEPLLLARFAPALGSYCALRVTLAPVGSESAAAATAPEMVGRTLIIDARIQRGGVGDPQPVALEASGERTVELTLRDATGIRTPLGLTGVEQPELLLAMVYDTWIDTAVLAASAPSVQGQLALDRVAASLALDVHAMSTHRH